MPWTDWPNRCRKAANALFRKAIQLDPGHYTGYYGFALSYARQGKNWLAMDYLERALLRYYPERSSIEHEPAFDNIRSKARFKRIMQHHFSKKSP